MNKAASIKLDTPPDHENRHACAFFNSDDEAYRVLLPFIAEGFVRGHKAVHIVAPDKEACHLDHLAALGIDASSARSNGQLEVRHNRDTYLKNGRFDPNRMLRAFESMATENRADGFPLSRIICDMDWAAEGGAVSDDLIEFEARVNAVWNRNPDFVICAYNLKTLSGDMVVDVLRTHPLVLIGNALQENPFFVPPVQFLTERGKQVCAEVHL